MGLVMLPGLLVASSFHLTAVPPRHGVIASEFFSCDESGADCSAEVPAGVVRTLSAYPEAGYEFAGWGGSCAGQQWAQCGLWFDGDKTVQATFKAQEATPEPQPVPPSAPPPPAPPAGNNLLKNPGFEEGLSSWSEWTENGQAVVGSDFPHSGKAAAYQYSKGGYFKHSLRQAVKVKNGAYKASCWIRGEGQELMLVARDYAWQHPDGKVTVSVPKSNEFKLITLDRVDVTAGSVMIAVWIEGPQSSWVEVDDCTLETF